MLLSKYLQKLGAFHDPDAYQTFIWFYVDLRECSCVQELTGFLAAHGNVLMGEEK